MSIVGQLRRLWQEPPPAYAFEISQGGIAWAARSQKRGRPPQIRFEPFDQEVLDVSPVKDNVLLPDALAQHVARLAPANGARRRRDAVLILPDYCARVAVLDFESFPSDRAEQLSLVRFRLKKTVPFELDSASVSYQVRPGSGRGRIEVLVAAAATEIVARYEAPFRAAGLAPGLATTSMLSAMDLLPADGLFLAAKLSGRVLTLAVCEGRSPKLLRCVELPALTLEEVMGVLFPTIAYAEDELPERPSKLWVAGFDSSTEELRAACERELALPVEPVQSRWGLPAGYNTGLLGYLQAWEAGA